MKIYKQRDFGELIGAPFILFGKNFKTIFVGLLIFVGPFILISQIMVSYFGFYPAEDIVTKLQNLNYGRQSGNSFLLQIFSFFQNVMLYSFIGAYFKALIETEPQNITISDIWNKIRKFYWPVAGGTILSGIIIAVGIVLLVFPGIYFAIALYPLFAIIFLEEKGVGSSISRSFELIKGEWWFTFVLAIVFFIILASASAILYLLITQIFNFISGGRFVFLLSGLLEQLIEVTVGFLIGVVPYFLYTSLITKKENPELLNKISEITEKSDVFENEDTVEQEKINETKDEKKPESDYKDDEKNRFLDDDENDRFKPKY